MNFGERQSKIQQNLWFLIVDHISNLFESESPNEEDPLTYSILRTYLQTGYNIASNLSKREEM